VTYLRTKNERGLKIFISNFASLSWRIALNHGACVRYACKKMADFDSSVLSLNVAGKGWVEWQKKVHASCCRQTAQSLLLTLEWLRQLTTETLVTFGLLSQVGFQLKRLVLHVRQCAENIFSKCNRFPYQPRNINEWFTITSAPRVRRQPVNVINVNRDGATQKCYTTQNRDENFPLSLETEDYEVFFHGTSHDHARNIIHGGIKLTKGDNFKDFSDGEGFYLTKQFDEAWKNKWASNRPSVTAVLVFRVRRAHLREGREALDLRTDEDQWKSVIRAFRSGKSTEQFQQYEFIEGPMSSISRGNQSLRNLIFHGDTYQLCVKHDNCAELFDRSLHSAVFFACQ